MATERELELAYKLWQWKPHSEGQREYMLCNAKNKTVAAGRRYGKSESTAVDMVLYALSHKRSIQFLIAPTDDQSKTIMTEISRRLHAVPGLANELREVKSPYHNIVFLDASGVDVGTTIKGRTAGPTGKGIRGNKAHRVILDEAAFIEDKIVDEAIDPLLADYGGDMIKISTPFGRNHFYRDYMKGIDGDDPRYRSFHHPSTANPYLSVDFLESKQRDLADRIWRQEYLAEFIADVGGVFTGVLDVVRPGPIPKPRGAVTIGVDLAKHQDFTVISGMDETGSQVLFERWTGVPWGAQYHRIAEIVGRYPGCTVYVDSTGAGDVMFEALEQIQGPIWQGYLFTNKSKAQLINNLALQIQRTAINLLDIPEQTAELESYEYTITPSRTVTMNAPSGKHDDCVIALALACWGLRDPAGVRFEDEMSLYL